MARGILLLRVFGELLLSRLRVFLFLSVSLLLLRVGSTLISAPYYSPNSNSPTD